MRERKSLFGYVLVMLFHEELEQLLEDMACVPRPGEVVEPVRARYDIVTDLRAGDLAMKMQDVSLKALLRIWLNHQQWLEWIASTTPDHEVRDRLGASVAAADQRLVDAIVERGAKGRTDMTDWDKLTRDQKLANVLYGHLTPADIREEMAKRAKAEGKRAPGADQRTK
jgi:hypothetical protein